MRYNKCGTRVNIREIKKGQFAEKNGDALKIELDDKPKYTVVKIPLDFFKHKGGKKAEVTGEILEPPKEAYGFANKERLYTDHHRTHAADMGYTPQEYEKAAIQFWNTSDGKLYYSFRRHNFCKIAKDNVTVCFCDSEGIVNTFYKYKNASRTKAMMIIEQLKEIK